MSREPISIIRIVLLVLGLFALVPLTIVFGLYGFVVGILFLVAAMVAK